MNDDGVTPVLVLVRVLVPDPIPVPDPVPGRVPDPVPFPIPVLVRVPVPVQDPVPVPVPMNGRYRQRSLPWHAGHGTDPDFLGDGQPSLDFDFRVRCWFCRQYTHHLQTPVSVLDATGARVLRWIDCRTCALGLGHDPFILRRCERFIARPPVERLKLPDEAFQRGWRSKYGDDTHMTGTDNTVA